MYSTPLLISIFVYLYPGKQAEYPGHSGDIQPLTGQIFLLTHGNEELTMTHWDKLLTRFIAVSFWIFISGCQQAGEPTLTYATDGEIQELLSKAESFRPIGEPTIDKYEHEGGMTFVHRQPLMLQGGGLGQVSVVHCCTGSCKVTTGTIHTCKATGCSTGGKSCSAISCTGGCVKDKDCTSCDNSLVIHW